jgi:hypothetical protein
MSKLGGTRLCYSCHQLSNSILDIKSDSTTSILRSLLQDFAIHDLIEPISMQNNRADYSQNYDEKHTNF